MVYDCFNNPFSADCGSPYLNLPPITIDDRTRPDKRSRYNPDLIPAAIYVASGNSVSDLTTSSDLTRLILLSSYDTRNHHVMKKDEPYRNMVKRGY